MPNIAATKEYTDKQTVPEHRKSSSCASVRFRLCLVAANDGDDIESVMQSDYVQRAIPE